MTYPRYDVYNPRIYGPETKHDVNVVTFIARHHLVLQRIVAEGGGKLLCQLWDNEVAECRRSIRQVESYQNIIQILPNSYCIFVLDAVDQTCSKHESLLLMLV